MISPNRKSVGPTLSHRAVTHMNHDEYTRDGRPRYELFAKTVVAILQAAIDAGPQEFRLQQITYRAKDPVSLKRKLTELDCCDSNSIEEELKDLAGSD
jgi:hypothetical protein